MTNQTITPSNLSRSQIETLAVAFAQATDFVPCKTNIYNYVKNLGGTIKYTFDNLDSNGGSIEVESPKKFTIWLSHATSPKRDIFTIAHELGHFVLHSRFGQIPIVAHRSEESSLSEKESNSFAASFLMPRDLFIKEYNICDGNKSSLAKQFNVSILAVSWRCKNLNLK